jgi:hypothetical protein
MGTGVRVGGSVAVGVAVWVVVRVEVTAIVCVGGAVFVISGLGFGEHPINIRVMIVSRSGFCINDVLRLINASFYQILHLYQRNILYSSHSIRVSYSLIHIVEGEKFSRKEQQR